MATDIKTLDSVIQAQYEKYKGKVNEVLCTEEGFKLDERYNYLFEENDINKLIKELSVKNPKGIFCDTTPFLYQNVYKHSFIITKRGVGKTYKIDREVIDKTVAFINENLISSLSYSDKSDVNMKGKVVFILQNTFYVASLIETLNELLQKNESLHKDITYTFNTLIGHKISLDVTFRHGGVYPFTKSYIIGECLFLTQPMLARKRQFSDVALVIFDEFEKCFSTPLLDYDNNAIEVNDLFINYKEIINSLQRNASIRFIYLGNISNTNSIIWQDIGVTDFNFKQKLIIHPKTNKVEGVVYNFTDDFYNTDMSNVFEDSTTLGIAEEDLINIDDNINSRYDIKEINKNCAVIFDDKYLYYFQDQVCRIYIADHTNLEKFNVIKDFEFVTTEQVPLDVNKLYQDFLEEYKYTENAFTRELFELDYLKEDYETYEVKSHITVYTIGNIIIKNGIVVEDVPAFLRGFRKKGFYFNNNAEYMLYRRLIRK